MESIEGFALVPVFSQSGGHADEAIRIQQVVKYQTQAPIRHRPAGACVCYCAAVRKSL